MAEWIGLYSEYRLMVEITTTLSLQTKSRVPSILPHPIQVASLCLSVLLPSELEARARVRPIRAVPRGRTWRKRWRIGWLDPVRLLLNLLSCSGAWRWPAVLTCSWVRLVSCRWRRGPSHCDWQFCSGIWRW